MHAVLYNYILYNYNNYIIVAAVINVIITIPNSLLYTLHMYTYIYQDHQCNIFTYIIIPLHIATTLSGQVQVRVSLTYTDPEELCMCCGLARLYSWCVHSYTHSYYIIMMKSVMGLHNY